MKTPILRLSPRAFSNLGRAFSGRPARVATAILAAASLHAMAGCANLSPDVYTDATIGEAREAVHGVVVSARDVRVRSEDGAGVSIGAILGGIGGSYVGGGGRENALGSLGGAILGGLLGHALDGGRKGVEYIVKTRHGQNVSVVQGHTKQPLPPGTPVYVITDSYGGGARVIPEQGGQSEN